MDWTLNDTPPDRNRIERLREKASATIDALKTDIDRFRALNRLTLFIGIAAMIILGSSYFLIAGGSRGELIIDIQSALALGVVWSAFVLLYSVVVWSGFVLLYSVKDSPSATMIAVGAMLAAGLAFLISPELIPDSFILSGFAICSYTLLLMFFLTQRKIWNHTKEVRFHSRQFDWIDNYPELAPQALNATHQSEIARTYAAQVASSGRPLMVCEAMAMIDQADNGAEKENEAAALRDLRSIAE